MSRWTLEQRHAAAQRRAEARAPLLAHAGLVRVEAPKTTGADYLADLNRRLAEAEAASVRHTEEIKAVLREQHPAIFSALGVTGVTAYVDGGAVTVRVETTWGPALSGGATVDAAILAAIRWIHADAVARSLDGKEPDLCSAYKARAQSIEEAWRRAEIGEAL